MSFFTFNNEKKNIKESKNKLIISGELNGHMLKVNLGTKIYKLNVNKKSSGWEVFFPETHTYIDIEGENNELHAFDYDEKKMFNIEVFNSNKIFVKDENSGKIDHFTVNK